MESVFRARFKQELSRFGVTKGETAKTILSLGPMSFGKTHNRSVLGTLNEMAFYMEVQLERLGRLPANDDELGWISRSINEMPCQSKNCGRYFTPTDEMRRLIFGI